MPLSVDRQRQDFFLQAQTHWIDKLAVATSRRGFLQAAGALIGVAVASRLGIAKAQAGGEVSPGTTQTTADDIKPCGPETLARTLCYDARSDDPAQQRIYLAVAPQGGDDDQSKLNFVLQCDIASKTTPEQPDKCFNPEGRETQPATRDNVNEPQFANVFATPQAEPTATPAPTPEPVAQPAEVDPFSLPTGVVFQEPNGPGKRWLGNVDSCIRDAQHYNPTTYKCISSQTVFSPSDPIVITFRREGNLPAEAKQGPGDRIMTRTIRVNSTGREQFRYSVGPEITRFSSGDVFYAPATGVFPTGVYEFSSNVNNGPDQFVYRIQFK